MANAEELDAISREYEPADFDRCLGVFDTNVPEFFLPEERQEYGAFLEALPGPYFVLLNESHTIIGSGGYAIKPSTGTADLCWGMVRRELHGQGLGRALTTLRLERIVQEPEVREVAMHTSQHTEAFYKVLGFRTIEIRADGYGPGLDRCEMRLTIPRKE